VDEPNWSPSQLAAQRTAKRRATYYSSLNLWPFVGVMIALVFLFVPMPRAHRRIAADRPVVAHPTPQPGALREDAVQVAVTRDGLVYCNHRQVQMAQLSEVIQASMRPSTERKIYVTADARAKYSFVMAVVEKIRLTGITRICFLAEKGDPDRFHH
jgi:biopolymer transport protein ExbD